MLLLHGGGAGAGAQANWAPMLEEVADRVHAIAPDLVGFGTTDHPDPPPYGPRPWLELRVEQLIAVLDHYGIERADLVGNSLGGALTLAFVLKHPDRVGRIVLMGSAGAPFKPGDPLIRLLTFYDDPTRENLKAIMESFVYDLEGFGDVDALVDHRLEVALAEDARRSFVAMFHDENGEPTRELALEEDVVRGITHEALLVHGREDHIIPFDASLWLLDKLPNSQLHVFSRCGHWTMLEWTRDFSRLVCDFCLDGAKVRA